MIERKAEAAAACFACFASLYITWLSSSSCGVVWCMFMARPADGASREREVVEQDEAVAHCLHLTATPSSDDVLEQLV